MFHYAMSHYPLEVGDLVYVAYLSRDGLSRYVVDHTREVRVGRFTTRTWASGLTVAVCSDGCEHECSRLVRADALEEMLKEDYSLIRLTCE